MTSPYCGTNSGRTMHTLNGTEPCEACKAARADYLARRRFVTGAQRTLRACRDCGSVFSGHLCMAPAKEEI